MLRAMGLCVLVAGLASAAAAQDSGSYRGPQRDGIYPGTNLLPAWPPEGPRLLWAYDDLGPGWGTPVVAGDTVYVAGGAPGALHAFTLDGQLKWKTVYGKEFQKRFDGARATPVYYQGTVALSSGVGWLYSFDAVDGKLRWEIDLCAKYGLKVAGWGYNETPLLVDGKLVMSARRGPDELVAVDALTGETAWTSHFDNTYANSNSSAVLVEHGGRRLVVHALWSGIVAVDAATGKPLWTAPIASGGTLTPVHHDGWLFVALDSGMGIMYRFSADPLRFEPIWSCAGVDAISQAVIVADKLFVLGRVVDPAAKGDKNKRATPTPASAPASRPALELGRNGTLSLVALDYRTGRVLHAVPVAKNGSLSAADGRVYLLEGGEGAWQQGEPAQTRLSLVQPTAEGFEIVSRFKPRMGSKEAWTGVAIAAGRLWHRHGKLLAVYDLRADGLETPASGPASRPASAP